MSEDDNSGLTRRRVLGGIATVGAASAAAGAGTMAYFSDEESSTDNTVKAGTLDLTVNSGNGFSYSADNIAPGDSWTVSVKLANSGSVGAEKLVVETSTDPGNDDVNLANRLLIDEMRWNGGTVTAPANTVGGLTGNDVELDATPTNSGTPTLAVDVTFDPNAGNSFQGASVDIDHTFHLYQDSSQV